MKEWWWKEGKDEGWIEEKGSKKRQKERQVDKSEERKLDGSKNH